MDVSPNDKLLVSGSQDKTAKVGYMDCSEWSMAKPSEWNNMTRFFGVRARVMHRYNNYANIHWYKLVYTSIYKCTLIYTSLRRYTNFIYLGIPRYTQVYM